MKTAFKMLLLALPLLVIACKEETDPQDQAKIERLRFSPVENERWVYKVAVTLDPSARNEDGKIESGSEGVTSSYEKVRRYLGAKPVQEGSEVLADCFEVSKAGKVEELEFNQMTEEGLVTLAWQEKGGERLVLAEPVLVFPAKKVPGSLWALSQPNPNDPDGHPMFSRQFQYFGIEEVEVMGDTRKAHRVKIVGRTGQFGIQRDLWFVNQLGIVKERVARYGGKKRLALFEEVLVAHERPE